MSDRAIRADLCETGDCCVRVSDVFERLGCRPQCGRCATSIRQVIRDHTASCDARALAACPSEPEFLLAAE